MQKFINWFVAGFGAAFGLATTLVLNAAVGDLVYKGDPIRKEITAQQAVCFAQCAKNAGLWPGAISDMIYVCASREFQPPPAPAKFFAEMQGLEYVSQDEADFTSPLPLVGIVK